MELLVQFSRQLRLSGKYRRSSTRNLKKCSLEFEEFYIAWSLFVKLSKYT